MNTVNNNENTNNIKNKEKIPYENICIIRKNEPSKKNIFYVNRYADNNLDDKIKIYKKELNKLKNQKIKDNTKSIIESINPLEKPISKEIDRKKTELNSKNIEIETEKLNSNKINKENQISNEVKKENQKIISNKNKNQVDNDNFKKDNILDLKNIQNSESLQQKALKSNSMFDSTFTKTNVSNKKSKGNNESSVQNDNLTNTKTTVQSLSNDKVLNGNDKVLTSNDKVLSDDEKKENVNNLVRNEETKITDKNFDLEKFVNDSVSQKENDNINCKNNVNADIILQEYNNVVNLNSNLQHVVKKEKFAINIFIGLIMALFVMNIFLSIVIFYSIKNGGTKNISVNNSKITVTGDSLTAQAVRSAWDTSVCIAAGGSAVDESSFYGKTLNRGSGVIFKVDDTNGYAYIITCWHVIDGYDKAIYVLLSSYLRPMTALIVGYSEEYDIAVLKVNVKNISNITENTKISTSDSSYLAVGENVFTIGNSLSSGLCVTNGIISMVNCKANIDGAICREIQTNATINPGNSGGGLFNVEGKFIGLMNAKLSVAKTGSTSMNVEGVSYAIPGNLVINIANSILRNNGKAQYIDLGVTFTHSSQYVSTIDINNKKIDSFEVRVQSISSDSCAKGIFNENDIIKSFTYTDINYKTHTVNMINEYCYEDICFNILPESEITFEIERVIPHWTGTKTVTVKNYVTQE